MILGIESSCDESALSLFCPKRGIIGEWVHSQIAEHAPFGGVVPGLATREHYKNLPRLLEKALPLAQGVETIAVTYGPGLAGCLALGLAQAKALALAWGKPLVGINHLRGHAFSPFLTLQTTNPEIETSTLFPQLGLLVSGGNSLLFRLDADRTITQLAQTVDDAAGEALDKGAKLLRLPYPGGPWVEKHAQNGDPRAFSFPRAFPQADIMKFSFSGLKTSLRYTLQALSQADIDASLDDLCASYQDAVIAQLCVKVEQAIEQSTYRSLGLSGGVSNNKPLRARLQAIAHKHGLTFLAPAAKHTGDNASMIAFSAYFDPQHTLPAPSSINPSLTL